MTIFEKFDLIADSVNPILTVLVLIITMFKDRNQKLRIRIVNASYFLVSIIFVYVISGIDYKWNLWSVFSLDFSTHTAFALSCVVYLIKRSDRLLIWAVVLLLYFFLILFQGYHPFLDILTTSIVFILALFIIYNGLNIVFKKLNINYHHTKKKLN